METDEMRGHMAGVG